MNQPFERIVVDYGSMVLRVCRAVLGPHTDADDAWSETFLSALRKYSSLPEDADVPAWLVTIAHRKAIDIIRQRKRQAIPVEKPDDETTSTVGNPDSIDRELWEALKNLPPKQRYAVVYHYVAGLPYREVAAIVGSSTDAVRRASSDGIASLRATYAGKEQAVEH